MPKIDKRRKECLKLMDKYEKEHKLSYDPDGKFPGMANVLEIRCDEKFGRHIVAKADIPAGKIVLAEKSFISRFIYNISYNSCSTCMSVSKNYIACNQCATALFCDSKCASSNKDHTMACPKDSMQINNPVQNFFMGAVLYFLSMFPNVQCLIEFVENAIEKGRPPAPKSLTDAKCKFEALLQLSRNDCEPAAMSQLRLKEANGIYNSLLFRKSIKKLFETEQKKRFLMHLVQHINCVVGNNGFSSKVSLSLFIIGSYFNHACAFNVIELNTYENVRYCKTVRPIKTGQQLFISYLPKVADQTSQSSVDYRQKYLYDHFGFQCECERCKPDLGLWTINSRNMQLDEELKILNAQLVNYGAEKKEEMLAFMEKTLINILNRFGDKHWCDELAYTIDNYYYSIFHRNFGK